MANPVFLYENPLELATLTAFNFAEDTANPLARQIDRDPTRLTLVGAAAGPTWNTSVELRFLLPTGGMPFTATHLYVPAGHNLNLADTIELESSIFGFGTSPQQNLNAVAVSAGALMLTLDITLTGAARRWIWLTINDADRATSQVVYQLGELFVSRQIQVASAIGIDPEWEHDRVPNLRVTESDTGLPRVVKRGEIRRTMRYRWNGVPSADRDTLLTLQQNAGSYVGFPMLPAGEAAPVFVRLVDVSGPRQAHPNPSVAEEHDLEVRLIEAL